MKAGRAWLMIIAQHNNRLSRSQF